MGAFSLQSATIRDKYLVFYHQRLKYKGHSFQPKTERTIEVRDLAAPVVPLAPRLTLLGVQDLKVYDALLVGGVR